MSETTPENPSGVAETSLITLYLRAMETQHPDAPIKDEKAVGLVTRLSCDFDRIRRIPMSDANRLVIILGNREIERYAQDFLVRFPDAVVHIGCGLNARFERVDNDRVEWYDLDMTDVMAQRQKLIRNESSRYHTLATSVFEVNWLEEVSRFKLLPFMFIAEGILPYFEEAQVKSLFLRLREHYPGRELVWDAHTPFVIWADSLHLAYAKVKARMQMKPGCLPIFTTDGLKLYFYALTAHFGQGAQSDDAGKPVWRVAAELLYGQVKKIVRRRRQVKVEHTMLWGEQKDLKAGLQRIGLSGRINTVFVERLNLTIRQGVSLLGRRTWGRAKYTPELNLYLLW